MTYTPDDVLGAMQRMVAIDTEHGRDPAAYARAVGLPPFVGVVAMDIGRNQWSVMVERGEVDPLDEQLETAVARSSAASFLRGIAAGLLLREQD